jgi:hypothetical protein
VNVGTVKVEFYFIENLLKNNTVILNITKIRAVETVFQ